MKIYIYMSMHIFVYVKKCKDVNPIVGAPCKVCECAGMSIQLLQHAATFHTFCQLYRTIAFTPIFFSGTHEKCPLFGNTQNQKSFLILGVYSPQKKCASYTISKRLSCPIKSICRILQYGLFL